jgi:hypothetical protein
MTWGVGEDRLPSNWYLAGQLPAKQATRHLNKTVSVSRVGQAVRRVPMICTQLELMNYESVVGSGAPSVSPALRLGGPKLVS